MQLASLHVYPLKGARGVTLERSEVLRAGLRHDRRFMVIDGAGTFLTQRSFPKLALLDVQLAEGSLVIGGAARAPLDDDAYRGMPRRRVRVWRDDVEAVEVPADVSSLVAEHLGTRCAVVFMPSDVVRKVEAPHGAELDRVGFADGYPLLVASRASLRALNDRLVARGEAPIPMDRFRPNLVVDGAAAWTEEENPRARIGAITVRLPKKCARCSVTTVDQATAAVGKEPLRTLASFRRTDNEVHFAMNAIPDHEGVIAVGDAFDWLD